MKKLLHKPILWPAKLLVTAVAVCLIVLIVKSCSSSDDVIYPAPLRPGDKVAIISPAGPINAGLIDSAAEVLAEMGYQPVIYPHAYGKFGHFSGRHDERLADLRAALTDPEIRAILCSRGGYGVVHSLEELGKIDLRDDPKWVIGFSDISALHALMASQGVASVHASMARQLSLGPDDPFNKMLMKILTGGHPEYKFPANPYNHNGEATGRLLGGNLAVIADLIGTPFNIIREGTILFIEDVSEPIYKTERIMYQLKLSGILPNLKGLIVGQFTDNKSDENHRRTEDMIREMVAGYDYPVAFGVPIGHIDNNVPVIESATVTLSVTDDGTILKFED